MAPILAMRHSSHDTSDDVLQAASVFKRAALTLKRSAEKLLREGGVWECVAGSFGDALNYMNIKTHGETHRETHGETHGETESHPNGDGSTFDQPFTLVLAASEEAERAILEALAAAGLDTTRTNTLRIPSRYRAADAPFRSADAHLGLGHYDDMFELLW